MVRTVNNILTFIVSSLLLLSCGNVPDSILLEAEFFDDYGGWVLDEQFYEQVGSAYLLAHGAGRPVADASTCVQLKRSSRYYAWVRTFNWNAPWDSLQAPGVFQLMADGKPLSEMLGSKGLCWDWQYAGSFVSGSNGATTLALRDLTGFEGRFDAVYLSESATPVFPASRIIPMEVSKEPYDLIVVGAGPAGLAAAISASRLGLKTLLLDDKPRLGGNSGPDIHVMISGRVHEGPYPKLGNVICEYGPPFRDYEAFCQKISAENNLTVKSLSRVVDVKMSANSIEGVVAMDYGSKKQILYRARLFADCTGDANLGDLSGARWMMGPESQEVFGESLAPEQVSPLSFGSTVRWTAVESDIESVFPDTPWAVSFDDTSCRDVTKGKWNWESGFSQNQIEDAETIRDYMFRVIYGNWSYQKNAPAFRDKYARMELTAESVSYFLGKRESRRLIGDYIITEKDCYGEWEKQPDPAVWCTYPIDQHFPTEEMTRLFPGQEFESTMKHNHMPLGVLRKDLVAGRDYNEPFMIPYRCLYSVNIPNLFMAGRNISGSRIAMCSYRVMATVSVMGEVVGIAASLCKEHNCLPRDIYNSYLDDLRSSLTEGVPSKYPEIFTPK